MKKRLEDKKLKAQAVREKKLKEKNHIKSVGYKKMHVTEGAELYASVRVCPR